LNVTEESVICDGLINSAVPLNPVGLISFVRQKKGSTQIAQKFVARTNQLGSKRSWGVWLFSRWEEPSRDTLERTAASFS
jgi:hypothetical protein